LANDTLKGGSGNDIFTPGEGHDTILGGAGTDTVHLSGRVSDYSMKLVGGTLVVSAANGSTATISDVEKLSFTGGQGDSAEELVARLYHGVLGREGNAFEIDYWAGVMKNGGSETFVASQFVNSPEAGELYRASGPAGFVTALYESMLGRTPAQSEAAFWVNGILAGVSRAEIALGFINSPEYLSHAVELDLGNSNVGVLLRLYQTIFDRAPDEAGLNYWLEQRENGVSMSSIASAFATSTEAGVVSNSAFVDQLFHGGLHRDPTAAEKTELVHMLEVGFERGQVLLQVAESADAVALVGVVTSTIETA
jgi:hypothetical protein